MSHGIGHYETAADYWADEDRRQAELVQVRRVAASPKLARMIATSQRSRRKKKRRK